MSSSADEVPVSLIPKTGKGCTIQSPQAVIQGNFCLGGTKAADLPGSGGSPAMPPPPPPGRRTQEMDDYGDNDDDFDESEHDDADGPDHGKQSLLITTMTTLSRCCYSHL